MPRAVQIDEYSCSTFLIQMSYGNQPLSIGTAFSSEAGNQLFLITNWHNVSGRNPRTGQCLSPTAAQPDNLVAILHADGKLGSWGQQTFNLLDEAEQPKWYEHPVHRQNVDVVALPVSCATGLTTYPINRMAFTQELNVRIGQDVFVIGYPFGLLLARGLPVWKRASVATEPDLDLESRNRGRRPGGQGWRGRGRGREAVG
jgi:hypothetical protein